MKKTAKQELEEIAAIEHDDPTGLYDNISIDGAIQAFGNWLSKKYVTTGADDGPRAYDLWLNKLLAELKIE